MTDKKDLQEVGEKEDLRAGQVIQMPIVGEMKKAYLDYAMSVIVSRALPDVRDGLKPVQRRIIYAASQMNLTSDSRYSKSAKWVGDVIGKYHPHGDSSIYDALVRMAQPFSLRYPLVDGQGNFGNIDGDQPAAMRYTEARLEKIAEYLLQDINKETVEFVDNYSAEYKEPVVLPSVFPNLLVNGVLGIAVAFATNIPPHNLNEVIDGIFLTLDKSKVIAGETIKRKVRAYNLIETEVEIKNWELNNQLTVEEIAKVIKGPDFPTGCTIYDHSETLRYFATGRGKIIQRASAEIIEQQNGKFSIVITQIPYQVNKTSLIEKIANLVTTKRTREISDIRDESSQGKIRIVVELKRNSRPQNVLNYLYKYTPLQTSFNANMIALVEGEPQVLSIKEFINLHIDHRRNVITNRTLYLLRKAREREHLLEGLTKALDFIDEVIELIKKSKDSDEARVNLVKRLKLTEIQAQAILDMQLKKLAALERKKIENELKEIQKNIIDYIEIVGKPEKMIDLIRSELLEVKEKFGDERKTKVIKGKIGEFNEEDLIANEETLISITDSGYIKRMKPSTYRTQSRGGKGVVGMKTKESDEVAMLRLADTHNRILFFTNKGKIYEKRVWNIPEGSRTSKGTAIVNLLEMASDEKLQEVITLGKDTEAKKESLFLLTATKNGNIKKTVLSEFENIRKTGIIAMGLREGDELVRAKLTDGNNDVIMVTAKGKSIRFRERDVRPMGRSASGVRGIRLREGDYVVSMEVIPAENGDTRILTVSENGYGKLSKISYYSPQKRGGTGVKAANITKKTGYLIAVRIVGKNTKDIIITSELGQIIRIPLNSIPTIRRDTQGVIIMRLNKGDRVSAVTLIDEDQEQKQVEKKP